MVGAECPCVDLACGADVGDRQQRISVFVGRRVVTQRHVHSGRHEHGAPGYRSAIVPELCHEGQGEPATRGRAGEHDLARWVSHRQLVVGGAGDFQGRRGRVFRRPRIHEHCEIRACTGGDLPHCAPLGAEWTKEVPASMEVEDHGG